MMLTDAHIKERLSEAYVKSISAAAGVHYESQPADFDYGIDGRFGHIRRRRTVDGASRRRYEHGPYIKYQLKATTTWRELESGKIAYDVDPETYNDIVLTNEDCRDGTATGMPPCMLLVLCMPQKDHRDEWADFADDFVKLMESVYWKFLVGPPTDNSSSETVHFSSDAQLTPPQLQKLIEMAANGGLIDAYL
jgi:hypothetical protein